MTLITEHEVISCSPLGFDFAPSWLSDVIEDREGNCMDKLFGWDFYQILLADLIAYDQFDDYDSDITYSDGDFALFEGKIFESLVDDNLGNPINDDSSWARVDKFQEDLYQELWQRYLLRIIAMECSLPAVTYATISATKQGLIKRNSIETGNTSASRGELAMWKDQVRDQIEDAVRLMCKWMEAETEKDGYNNQFSEVKFIKSITSDCKTTSGTITRGKRRFFFRNR